MSVQPLVPGMGWNTNFDPPPQPGASAQDVAPYVEDVIAELLCPDGPLDDRIFEPPNRWQLRAFFRAHGWDWATGVAELRRREIVRRWGKDDGRSTNTDSGIIVLVGALEALTKGLRPLCPVRVRGIGAETFRRRSWPKPCRSWSCVECGPKMADQLFAEVRSRILSLAEVFVSETQWNDNLAGTMSVRNRSHGVEYFFYRDITGRVTFFADRLSPARVPPLVWRSMPPEVALHHLASNVMWVPGHASDGWSTGWRPLASRATAEEGLILTTGFSEPEVTRILAVFADEAEKRFGVQIESGHIPPEHLEALRQLLDEIMDRVRKEGGR